MKPALTFLAVAVFAGGCSPRETRETSPATAPAATQPAAEPRSATVPVRAPEGSNAGTRYVYGVVGAIDSSRARIVEAELKRALDTFQAAEGRYPRTLDELVAERYLPALPQLPEGVTIQYDAQAGTARVVTQR